MPVSSLSDVIYIVSDLGVEEPVVATPWRCWGGSIVQRSLESSNVNVVEEMVNMIETQQAYEVSFLKRSRQWTACFAS